ncbi:disease resistance protein RPV1-like [Eucalyptus grandis]|uniref:disease resistance protein RPV1-like n=1 Tax=Eucalyptus grandis TaxID=71139 RepID=UPI00192ED203|nr:disease resistance protein RPV1-like [Eucalyptus grandis]
MLMKGCDFPTRISQVPSSIGALVNLECLAICGASQLTVLPDSIGMLKCLAELDVSSTGIAKLPNTIINLKSLKALNMSRSYIKKLPEAIGMLEKLEEIYGMDCNWLETIPGDIAKLPFLKNLILTKTRVKNIPKLPQSLVCLCLSSRASEKAPDISNLMSLRSLELCFSISTFNVSCTQIWHLRTSMPHLRNLAKARTDTACFVLELINCKNLRQIGQLPSSLTEFKVDNCNLLEVVDLSNLSNFQNLKALRVRDCLKLVEIQGLDQLESLEILVIKRCSSWLRLPDLSNWKKLKEWDVDALTTYSARGKRVTHSEDRTIDLVRSYLERACNPELRL